MNSESRRNFIDEKLSRSEMPIKGSSLAEELGITRQVIVKDIALLRAQGKKIIATPEGYMKSGEQKHYYRKVIATCHRSEDIEEELSIMVKFGGIIEDVIVEHPLYGEMKAMLMIKTLHDVQNFVKRINENKAEPLMTLTGGVHLHTIATENLETIEKIEQELKNKKYLIV